jgi:hypothetical protein
MDLAVRVREEFSKNNSNINIDEWTKFVYRCSIRVKDRTENYRRIVSN